MKINERFESYRLAGSARQIIRIMKITAIIMTVFLLQVSALTKAQITLNAKKASLQAVLETISTQSGYDFIYSDNDLKNTKLINIKLDNATIEKALQVCFDGQPLIYEISDKTVMVKRKEETSFFEHQLTRFQAIDVRGRVIDRESGLPLSGANVKSKSQLAVTNKNGEFLLRSVEEGTILMISYTGFETREIKAQIDMGDILLQFSHSKLNEVQIIAYGEVNKKHLTSNINSIKANAIATQPVTNPLLALQGRTPGIFIQQTGGNPGASVNVTIQGRNSILNGNEPFYVVDGVPYPSQLMSATASTNILPVRTSALNYINPADIESIEILKDADATAIYGSRAANGAILITTKKGRAGETSVNLSTQTGLGRVSRLQKLLNTDQYITLRKEALQNGNIPIDVSDYDINGTWDANRNVDWQKELVGGTAHFTNLHTSISGGTINTQFSVSGSYNRQTTVYPTDLGDTKANVHLSLNHSSTDKRFKVGITSSYQQDVNELPSTDLMSIANTLAPNAPSLYNIDGSINWGNVQNTTNTYSFDNPIAFLLQKYSGKTDNLLANGTFGYEIFKGLELKTSLGFNRLRSDDKRITPLSSIRPDLVTANSRAAAYQNRDQNSWIAEPQISYSTKFENSVISILVGSTFQQLNTFSRSFTASGFSNDGQLENIQAAPNVSIGAAVQNIYKYNAIFGRLNYRYKDRYILNLNARRDGSSRFGSENLFNNFYSIGGAWLFDDESFVKTSLPFISSGKLRATYGTTGNDQIPDYGFLSLYSVLSVNIPYQSVVSLQPTGHSNPFLQWEETKKLNFGLDLGVFKEMFQFSFNYFRNRSSNQLLSYPLLLQTGFPIIKKNIPATVQNTGFEFQLDASPFKKGALTWLSSVNLTIPKNKLLRFDGLEQTSYASNYVIGQPTTINKVYRFIGVNPQTGLYEFMDKSGHATSSPSFETDRTALVDTSPKYYGGWLNTISFKGFDLGILLQFVKQTGINYRFGASAPGIFNVNQPANYIDRWKSSGDIAGVQKATLDFNEFFNPYFAALDGSSDASFSDASYIRAKNISLSYSLPKSLLEKIHVKNAKVSLQGQNVFTITNYKGTDPETLSAMTLPTLKMYTIGLQLTL